MYTHFIWLYDYRGYNLKRAIYIIVKKKSQIKRINLNFNETLFKFLMVFIYFGTSLIWIGSFEQKPMCMNIHFRLITYVSAFKLYVARCMKWKEKNQNSGHFALTHYSDGSIIKITFRSLSNHDNAFRLKIK